MKESKDDENNPGYEVRGEGNFNERVRMEQGKNSRKTA